MSNILPQVISGFAGAFFAFLFMRLADTGKSIVDRQNQHFRSLGKLEILFGDVASAIQSNQYELEHFLRAYAHLQESKCMVMTPNRPQPLEFRDDAFAGLGNGDLLNEIMSYRAQARSISRNITALWGMHEKFRDIAFTHPDRLQDYIDNFAFCAKSAQRLTVAHAQLLDQTMRLQAAIRILYRRDRTWLHRLCASGIRTHYPKRMDKLLTCELKKLQSEIDKSLCQSKQRVDEILREQKRGELQTDPRGRGTV